MKRRVLFGSICAQQDNLGDIAIRRIFFDQFIAKDVPVVLLTQGMPQSYIDAFEFKGPVKFVSNSLKFQLYLALEAIRGRADLAYAPGPHLLKDTPAGLVKSLLMTANIVLVRARGGVVQTAGRALRGNGRVALAFERLLIKMCKTYVVRDSLSSIVASRPLQFAPDLALGRKILSRSEDRKVISCSFRNDTSVNRVIFKRMLQEFQDLGFEVVLVSQVHRDDTQHMELARDFGLKAYTWQSKNHRDQQEVVDSIYSKSFAVVSNRLHGLIFGINSGAIPIEYRFTGADKISSTLEPSFGTYSIIWNEIDDLNESSTILNMMELRQRSADLENMTSDAMASVSNVLSRLTGGLHPVDA